MVEIFTTGDGVQDIDDVLAAAGSEDLDHGIRLRG